jgi:AraC family transcriptional regulator
MDTKIEQAVLRAIETMRENLSDDVGLEELARAAIFSKFYFSRVFHRVTGLSPGHFLSAVRIEEAKRLLTTTPMTVTEITHRVGYTSVGSFTTLFTSSVGATPTRYRQIGQTAWQVAPNAGAGRDAGDAHPTVVRGNVWSPLPDQWVFVGLFPDRILQGLPVKSTARKGPGPYLLEDVPPGAWHLLACSAPGNDGASHVGRVGPLAVRQDTGSASADIRLRPKGPFDPPVLLALKHMRPGLLTSSVG